MIVVKLPQIIKLIRAKSGAGISMVSVYLELMAVVSSCAYGYASNFPFRSVCITLIGTLIKSQKDNLMKLIFK